MLKINILSPSPKLKNGRGKPTSHSSNVDLSSPEKEYGTDRITVRVCASEAADDNDDGTDFIWFKMPIRPFDTNCSLI